MPSCWPVATPCWEQAPLDDLIPLCQTRGTSLVIGGPLNSGILAGRDTWNYDKAPPEIVDRVKKITAVCQSHNVPLPAARAAVPASASGGRQRHPRPAQRRRVQREPAAVHHEDPARPVVRPAQ